MDNTQKKVFLYMALALVSMLMIERWNLQKMPKENLTLSPIQQHHEKLTVDNANTNTFQKTENQKSIQPSTGKLTHLQNSKIAMSFNEESGEIINAKLKHFSKTSQRKEAIQLYNNNPDHFYFAETGFTDSNHQIQPIQYSLKKITSSEATLEGKLEEITVIKKISLEKNTYVAHVDYQIQNNAQKTWKGQFFQQITKKLEDKKSSSLFHALTTYEGTAISNPNGKHYQKISYKDLKNKSFSEKIKGGWLGIQQHYFLSAWLLDNKITHNYYANHLGEDTYSIGAISSQIEVAPDSTGHYSSRIYIGPELLNHLNAAAPALDLTVDFGWLWWFAKPILSLLVFLNTYINNWGWSIIAVTFLIKLIFYKLSAKSFHSMANMRKIQPKIEALKKRCGDNKEEFGRETMALYQKEKVNPFSGCLPMLVQIPVFISLYYVLLESVQLRHANFIFWIHDLSIPDPYFVLPVMMGLIMFVQQKMSPPPPDPAQAKMMMIFPVLFTVIGLNFSSGLALYMLTNVTLSIAQQAYITRSYERKQQK